MRAEEVAKSKEELAAEVAASPKTPKRLEEQISFTGGRMSMRSESMEAVNRRTSIMLRAEREAAADDEERARLEKLENKHLQADMERDDIERMTQGSAVTYRPSRKPGEGPNIQRDGATY